MNGMFDTIRTAMRKRAAYTKTVREIERMPDELAKDLGIDRGDAHRLAHMTVYGK